MPCYRKCLWNYNGMCCPESEEDMDNAILNDEYCPTFLRADFEQALWNVHYDIIALLKQRTFDQLNEIKEFIVRQEEVNQNNDFSKVLQGNKYLDPNEIKRIDLLLDALKCQEELNNIEND